MKLVGLMFADFAESFLGGPAGLAQNIGSRSVIAHALHRFQHIEGLDRKCLYVQPRDLVAARAALGQADAADRIELLGLDDGVRPRRELLRSARKWRCDAWRGGLLGMTYFDEFVEPRAVWRAFAKVDADALLCLDGAMPALDPRLATAMVAHARANEAETPLVFTQAPPGVAGIILRREILEECAKRDMPIGLRLSYRPEMPGGDLINRPPCVPIDVAISQTRARLTGDTAISRTCLSQAFAVIGETADAPKLFARLRQGWAGSAAALPTEIEIELTTDDPLPETTLRPRGERVSRRVLADEAAIGRIARELAAPGDRLVVLGGHGDPLAHPRFDAVCRVLREAGVCGIAVVTSLVNLTDDHLATLREARVDALQVQIDADTAATYQRVHRRDAFETVWANIRRVEDMRRKNLSPWPIIVPSLTRCGATIDEMEAFYDRWTRTAGGAVISGYSDFGGLMPADGLLQLTPAVRHPCRRLTNRLMLLADGRVTACSEDVFGSLAFGEWTTQSLHDIWVGTSRDTLRSRHAQGNPESLPQACQVCREWHRE